MTELMVLRSVAGPNLFVSCLTKFRAIAGAPIRGVIVRDAAIEVVIADAARQQVVADAADRLPFPSSPRVHPAPDREQGVNPRAAAADIVTVAAVQVLASIS